MDETTRPMGEDRGPDGAAKGDWAELDRQLGTEGASPLDLDSDGMPDPPVPPGDGGGRNAAEGLGDLADWFYRNNPLYLLSVLLMFAGLFLVSQANDTGVDLFTVVGFYGVQAVYELLMLGMGLYLLKTLVNRGHGLILLFFLLIFACDLTFYQVRISGLAGFAKQTWVAQAVAAGTFLFAAFKLGLVVWMLGLKSRVECLAYSLGAFALIYLGPQKLYALIDAGRATATTFGWWEIYLLWLVAAALALPVIVANWRATGFAQPRENPYVGDENRLYRWLVLLPAVVVPLQIVINIHPDARSVNPNLDGMLYCMIPYLVTLLFLVEVFAREFIAEWVTVNFYDFWLLLMLFVAALLAQGNDMIFLGPENPKALVERFGDLYLNPYRINLLLVIFAQAVCALTRANAMSAGFVLTVGGYFMLGSLKQGVAAAYDYANAFSRVTWAAILMVFSFLFLGLGFAMSLLGARKPDPTPVA